MTRSSVHRLSTNGKISMKGSSVGDWLIGKYDNKIQADNDFLNGKPTAKDGGHEYVEASITKYNMQDHTSQSNLVASYWFGNDPEKVPFRFRLYQLETDCSGEYIAVMKLYKPTDATNEKLKSVSFDLDKYLPSIDDFELLTGCDVGWSDELSFNGNTAPCYKGVLVHGSCTVCSQNDPNLELIIKDELYLWDNTLWINDRVYTKAGQLIIGNTEGVPYKMVKNSDSSDEKNKSV